ncbi:transposase [Streptococcus troglodytae]|uniref:Transposase n=1 Tax=Streptococcus troglodytae TaxID=1111760 RepID=A0A1L7LGN8_9STRE|nr:transposase [Streptococcus troglodytae]
MWFYGFKDRILATPVRVYLNYVVTPASVYDRQMAEELLENTTFPVVQADWGSLNTRL